MGDLHLFYCLGELREAEKQIPHEFSELTRKIQRIRKRIEGYLVSGAPPNKSLLEEIDMIGLECIHILRERGKEVCPTCLIIEKTLKHRATHRVGAQ